MLQIPNGLIGVVERGALSALGSPLTVRCKHFLTLTFLISKDKDCQDLFETLTRCARPGMFTILREPRSFSVAGIVTLSSVRK